MTRGITQPWIAAPGLSRELGESWARSWPSWFGATRTGLARAPEKHDLARVETPLGPVVAKRSMPHGWKRSLVSLRARRPGPERAFRNAEALCSAALATPEPLAVLGRPEDAVLVTRYVEGHGLWELWSRGHGPALLELLPRELARLHRTGFRHRDLKASNLLFAGSDAAPELVWTDLDGLRQLGTVEPRLRARDLARLGTSFESRAARQAGVRAGDWPTLVRRYLQASLGRAPDADESAAWLGWTRRWREHWVRHHLARGRMVQ